MFAEKIARSLGVFAICSQIIVTVAIVSLAPAAQPTEVAIPDTAAVQWEPSDLSDE